MGWDGISVIINLIYEKFSAAQCFVGICKKKPNMLEKTFCKIIPLCVMKLELDVSEFETYPFPFYLGVVL